MYLLLINFRPRWLQLLTLWLFLSFYLSIPLNTWCQLLKYFFFSKLELCCLFRLKQSKELDAEKAFANEQLTRAILRERISNEEERAKAKHLVSMEDLVGRSCLQGNCWCLGEACQLPMWMIFMLSLLSFSLSLPFISGWHFADISHQGL